MERGRSPPDLFPALYADSGSGSFKTGKLLYCLGRLSICVKGEGEMEKGIIAGRRVPLEMQ